MAEGGISRVICLPVQNILLPRQLCRFPAIPSRRVRHPSAISCDTVCCAVIPERIGTYDRQMTQLKRDDADTA